MADIVPLRSVPDAAVESLLDHAFGTDRFGRTAYRLRKGTQPIAELSFAMTDEDGGLLGSIQCWPVMLARDGGACDPLVMLGPVAVEPAAQQGGIGKTLMRATLAAWEAGNFPPLMMIGDPEYYGRFFGFSADDTSEWVIDGPVERRRLLALAQPGHSVPRFGRIVPRPA
ncbi:GNAT family N-acetyltransferase [Sphingomonas sp. LaA6.9]|uniref:GNAT family N-acetyltransferase n=1 Tax=Sphingomonas sp. LaA6.9 TaxID=2919914 RepID=UPI001F4F4FBF|nr:N-acetyltransferase [Sphingomonas sp. LaA6.9]MCJ8156948.1 N-acetyltransferase [Sphingomonas sp. LaA6.9]